MAQDKTYTVKEGDTLSEIAGKFGVKTKSVLAANNLSSADRLKLGQKLRIPAATVANSTAVKDRSAASHTGYTVREGDNDVLIAKRLGVKPKELRLANMGTKWTSLHPGQVLNIPGNKRGWFATLAHRSAGAPPVKVVAVKTTKPAVAAKKPVVVAKTYKVQSGDNDWIIAKKVGTKPSVLRTLNPGVKWASVQIGTSIRIPGQVVKSGNTTLVASKSSEPKVKRLRSRYAIVTGDSVTLRRGPGTDHEIVTRVDQGTKVMVLDREGTWYKARFPRGTEAWVRGDFLTAASAPVVVASNNEGRRRKRLVAKNEDTPLRSSSRFSRSRHESSSKPKYARGGSRPSNGPVADIDTDGNPVLARAKAMLGVRYRYGAASRGATDCSGLTSQAYRAAGVNIPRTAIQQSRIGKAVDKNGLKPGDLVFFKTNRGTRINHVGTYLGNGKFIHASSGRGQVMVSSLNEGYYQRRYAGGRHIANFKSKKASEPKKVVAKKEEAPKVDSDPVTTPVEPPKTGDN